MTTPSPNPDGSARKPVTRGDRSTRGRPLAFGLCFVICAALFDEMFTTLVIAGLAWLAYEIFFRINRKAILCTVSVVLSFMLLEYVGARIIRWKLSTTHLLDQDHRMVPNYKPWINSDGVRCPVEADQIRERDYNIVCLGDSFTYGERLKPGESPYPAQLEQLIAERQRGGNYRVVNFGWTSSSPALSGRLLEDIGKKYKPDLVILALDMTDFHDDLKARYGVGSVATPIDYLARYSGLTYDALKQLRDRWRAGRWIGSVLGREEILPDDRFFITSRPLGSSLVHLKETESNIRRIHAFCRDVLKCRFLLFALPRSYQYTDRECRDSWERPAYEALGPYVKEPFVWLKAFKGKVDFPVHSLYDDFRNADAFPLYFEDDPHWNEAGHRVAAGALLRILEQEKLLP